MNLLFLFFLLFFSILFLFSIPYIRKKCFFFGFQCVRFNVFPTAQHSVHFLFDRFFFCFVLFVFVHVFFPAMEQLGASESAFRRWH